MVFDIKTIKKCRHKYPYILVGMPTNRLVRISRAVYVVAVFERPHLFLLKGGFLYEKKDNDMTKIATREFNQKIGYRIYLRRKILKLSQKNIADELNVSPQNVQKYESGENALNIYTLYRIALFLGVDISYFFQDVKGSKNKFPKFYQEKHLQELLKDFIAIKDKKIAQNIKELIASISHD